MLQEDLLVAESRPAEIESNLWQQRYEALLRGEMDPAVLRKPAGAAAERLESALRVVDAAIGVETQPPAHIVEMANCLRLWANAERMRSIQLRAEWQGRQAVGGTAIHRDAQVSGADVVDRCFSPPLPRDWDMPSEPARRAPLATQ